MFSDGAFPLFVFAAQVALHTIILSIYLNGISSDLTIPRPVYIHLQKVTSSRALFCKVSSFHCSFVSLFGVIVMLLITVFVQGYLYLKYFHGTLNLNMNIFG